MPFEQMLIKTIYSSPPYDGDLFNKEATNGDVTKLILIKASLFRV
jgi:hypothetical protein